MQPPKARRLPPAAGPAARRRLRGPPPRTRRTPPACASGCATPARRSKPSGSTELQLLWWSRLGPPLESGGLIKLAGLSYSAATEPASSTLLPLHTPPFSINYIKPLLSYLKPVASWPRALLRRWSGCAALAPAALLLLLLLPPPPAAQGGRAVLLSTAAGAGAQPAVCVLAALAGQPVEGGRRRARRRRMMHLHTTPSSKQSPYSSSLPAQRTQIKRRSSHKERWLETARLTPAHPAPGAAARREWNTQRAPKDSNLCTLQLQCMSSVAGKDSLLRCT